MNNASLSPVQGPLTVACMIVTSLSQLSPTDFFSSLQSENTSENTSLHNEILLQIWTQQEDSAMLLASNKQHKEITKRERHNRIDKTHRKGQQGRTKTKERKSKRKDLLFLRYFKDTLLGVPCNTIPLNLLSEEFPEDMRKERCLAGAPSKVLLQPLRL
jgi:hypothetical protein